MQKDTGESSPVSQWIRSVNSSLKWRKACVNINDKFPIVLANQYIMLLQSFRYFKAEL